MIHMEGVGLSIPTAQALRSIDLHIERGEFAFRGCIGQWKSSLPGAVSRVHPDRWSCHRRGDVASSCARSYLRRQVGVVPGSPPLPDKTAWERRLRSMC